jgi:hypothetical protein
MQIDLAVVAEVIAFAARRRVQRQQLAVDCAGEDALRARRTRRRLAVLPVGHAAAGDDGGAANVRLGVVHPLLRPRDRIERHDAIARRAEIKRVIGEDRRRLDGEIDIRIGHRQVAGAIGPGDLEVSHILRRDLGIGGMTHAADVMAPFGPAIDHAADKGLGIGFLTALHVAGRQRGQNRKRQHSANMIHPSLLAALRRWRSLVLLPAAPVCCCA